MTDQQQPPPPRSIELAAVAEAEYAILEALDHLLNCAADVRHALVKLREVYPANRSGNLAEQKQD
jgi:hypothetical protein